MATIPNGIQELRQSCEDCNIPSQIRKELCPYCRAQSVLKGKWKLLILWHLMDGTKRFSELKKLIPATQSSLTLQLRELEDIKIINRKVYNVIPPKVEYSLTPLGRKFSSVLDSMHEWGTEFTKLRKMQNK